MTERTVHRLARIGLVVGTLVVACRRSDPPLVRTDAATVTEVAGNGFRAKLPGAWKSDDEPPLPGDPDMHSYVDAAGTSSITTGRHPFKKGLSREDRRRAAQKLLEMRRQLIPELAPGATVSEPKLVAQGTQLIGALSADGTDVAARYHLVVTEDAAFGIFYEEHRAPDGRIDERFRALRDSFEILP